MFTPVKEIARQFSIPKLSELGPRYNVTPTQPVAAIRSQKEGLRSLDMLRWGLVPDWAKELSIGSRLINARAETVAEKPAFRHAFTRRRCLILASGFYEWGQTPDGEFPFFISPSSDECLAFAGLWEQWWGGGDVRLESCVIITTAANATLTRVHHRMPAILAEDAQMLWLDSETSAGECLELLRPAPEDNLEIRRVRRMVNNPGNDGVELIKEVSAVAD